MLASSGVYCCICWLSAGSTAFAGIACYQLESSGISAHIRWYLLEFGGACRYLQVLLISGWYVAGKSAGVCWYLPVFAATCWDHLADAVICCYFADVQPLCCKHFLAPASFVGISGVNSHPLLATVRYILGSGQHT